MRRAKLDERIRRWSRIEFWPARADTGHHYKACATDLLRNYCAFRFRARWLRTLPAGISRSHFVRAPPLLRRLDLDELDVEHEHARRLPRLVVVRELLRDPEARLLADDHQLHAFGPSLDHATEREL